ncbi:MAG: hypothetical protein KBC62_01985 [Candidatus Pacebacteria bacterium]|nr:hypothetical protein [Candidatus Paceibacterota bacterium]
MKRGLIIVCVIALLVAGYAFLVLFGTEKANPTTEQVEQVSVDGVGTPTDKKLFSGIGSLKKLQAEQKDLECQVVFEQGDKGNIEGTYFTSKGNVRGDFVVPAPEFGGTILSSMIVGGNAMYVWSKIGGDTFGFKSDVTKERDEAVDTNEPVPLDAEVKYTCTEWTEVDGSVFVPPVDVQFQDIDAVIDAGMEYGTIEPEF